MNKYCSLCNLCIRGHWNGLRENSPNKGKNQAINNIVSVFNVCNRLCLYFIAII